MGWEAELGMGNWGLKISFKRGVGQIGAYLVAPAMQETQVHPGSRKIPWVEMATHCRILCLENPEQGGAGYDPWGHRVRYDGAIEHTLPIQSDS